MPTMLSREEQKLLYVLARDHWSGEGAIVDAGCFLGGSTVALAAGVRARGDGDHRKAVVTFDHFVVDAVGLEYFPDDMPPEVGDSFQPAFQRNIEPYADVVDLRAGDFKGAQWDGTPIEVLFLDVCKSWELNGVAQQRFFPTVVPGHGVIVQQDYLWGSHPWIHVLMEAVAPYVRQLPSLPWATVPYLLERPVPRSLLKLDLQWDLSRARHRALTDRAAGRWTGAERGLVETAQGFLALVDEGPRVAARAACEILERFPEHPSIRVCALALLEEARVCRWRPFLRDRAMRAVAPLPRLNRRFSYA